MTYIVYIYNSVQVLRHLKNVLLHLGLSLKNKNIYYFKRSIDSVSGSVEIFVVVVVLLVESLKAYFESVWCSVCSRQSLTR